ncbi:MAG TPA: choice-of-anchor Q domain-containing protein [Candidatus Binataceae bacterium]|nr:choice-of-anchor Q domain-containing protein [Candidatus Binataceae bacterium]
MRKYQQVARQLTAVERTASSDPRLRRLLAAAPMVVLFALLNVRPVRAACTLSPSPDPTVDGSSASLRAAIETANASTEDCVINLATGTYTLTIKNTDGQDDTAAEGDLDITAPGQTVTLQGAGRRLSIVNANGIDRAFQVLGGANAVFRDLTIEGGVAQDDGTAGALAGSTEAEGGGILVQDGGHVLLSRVWLTNNQAIGGLGTQTGSFLDGIIGGAAAGGGLFLSAGTIQLTNSKVFGNTATGGAGARGFFGGSTVCLVCGTFYGGAGGSGEGGGLYVLSGNVAVSTSTLSGNNATGGAGGLSEAPGTSNYQLTGPPGNGGAAEGAGLFLASGTVTVGQTTLSGNVATGGIAGYIPYANYTGASGSALGAAGSIASGNLRLTNSTLFGNTAENGTFGYGGTVAGGGLYAGGGSLELKGVTVASNQALATSGRLSPIPSSGGGIANAGATNLLINTTLIANNTQNSGNPDNGADVSGAITASFSLIGQSAGATITDDGHNLLDVNPVLDPLGLRSNGGPTQTVALESGSPAIDAGDNPICAAAPPRGLGGIDQRSFARSDSAGDHCDIGAFEVQAP